MTVKQHARRLVWPLIFTLLSFGVVILRAYLGLNTGGGGRLSVAIMAVGYFSAAWLSSRLLAMALDRMRHRRRQRPYPRLLYDLIAVLMFMLAFAASVALFMGEGIVGALAGSGIILALLGFAIRNVVADTLSGVALGIEGPFRIGDWIDIDNLARGKVIEISWRTTRILTSDSIYMILPNSQIARQRITNYSAPKPQYRAQITLTLDHAMPIATARAIMQKAAREASLIRQDPPPDIRVMAYQEDGITYAVRYWISKFEHYADCRDEMYSVIDQALRGAGVSAPYRRIELVRTNSAAQAEPGHPTG